MLFLHLTATGVMDLETVWKWDKRPLRCKVREESGNPAQDDLRERLAEIAKINLNELFTEMKNKKKKEVKTSKSAAAEYEVTKTFNDVLSRTLVEGAGIHSIKQLEEGKESHLGLSSTRNLNKRFFNLPKAPPRRVLLEIQRDRAKPLKVVDQDEEEYTTSKLEKRLKREYAAKQARVERAAKEDANNKESVDLLEKQGLMAEAFAAYAGDKFGSNGLYLEGMLYVSRLGGTTEAGKLIHLGVREEKFKIRDSQRTPTGAPAVLPVGVPSVAVSGPSVSTVDEKDVAVLEKNGTNVNAFVAGTQIGIEQGGMPGTERVNSGGANLSPAVVPGSAIEDASIVSAEKVDKEGSQQESPYAAKLYCASVLCNWSRNAGNAERLVLEGAVRAIIQLSAINVPHILYFCAAGFRYMSEQPLLAKKMIEDGAVLAMNELVNNSRADEFITANCCIALVNLTRVNGYVGNQVPPLEGEGTLVEAGITLSFLSIITSRTDFSSACARGLYNLTCVDASYQLIERVIRALVQLSTASSPGVKHICAAALCNLSDLKNARQRMLEEGVIAVLKNLVTPPSSCETRTRRVCAVILQNLSATNSCRVDMVARKCVEVTYSLSNAHDPIILRCIGLTLSRLAHIPINCPKIIAESGTTALCQMAQKYPTIPGISQPAALAFQLISAYDVPAEREKVVSGGCVTAIATLLQSTDMFTLQQSLLALCHLLLEPENHITIVQQGMIATLGKLSSHDNDLLMDLCALAFLNFSSSEESRKHVVSNGAVVAIISLSCHKSIVTQRRCAAALCNVTSYEAGMQRMVTDGIVPALVNLVVSSDVETVRYACAAICRMCSTVENGKLVMASGAIPHIVREAHGKQINADGGEGGDVRTMITCCAALSTLSFYECCRIELVEFGIISALKALSELNDEATQERCLVAFANLSFESSVQPKMIENGVVEIIAKLANSYHEPNQMFCAKALCNLSCCDGYRLKICKDGGLTSLMMISMVRSVDNKTKMICVNAMSNLCEESTIDIMLEEGLVSSVANLSKLCVYGEDKRDAGSPDLPIVLLCVKLFNKLTSFLCGREEMVAKRGPMQALFNVFEVGDMESKIICARTVANMVMCDSVRARSIESGALNILNKGMALQDKDASKQCVMAIYVSSQTSNFRVMLGNSTLPVALVDVSFPMENVQRYEYAMRSLCNTAYDHASRAFLQQEDFIRGIIDLTKHNMKPHAAEFFAITLCVLTFGYANPYQLVQFGICDALQVISEAVPDNLTVIRAVVNTLRALCTDCPEGIAEIATPSMINILKMACDVEAKELADHIGQKANEEPMYNVAAVIFIFSQNGDKIRARTATPVLLEILYSLRQYPSCVNLLGAALAAYTKDPASRGIFACKEICSLVVRTMSENFTVTDRKVDMANTDAVYNLVSTVCYLSKMPACRELLGAVEADSVLFKLTLFERKSMSDPDMKGNAMAAIKGLGSDSSGTLEENQVSQLIAMALEGVTKQQTSEDDLPPPIEDQNYNSVQEPSYYYAGNEEGDHKNPWYAEIVLTKGGAAGKGESLPEPPQMKIDGAKEYPLLGEEIPVDSDSEGKTKMAFAKMQVPADLKSQYLLDDKDFEVGNDKKEETKVEEIEDNAATVGTIGPEGSIAGGSAYSDDFGEQKSVESTDRKSPTSSSSSRPNSRGDFIRKTSSSGLSPRGASGSGSRDRTSSLTAKSSSNQQILPSIGATRKVSKQKEGAEHAAQFGLYS